MNDFMSQLFQTGMTRPKYAKELQAALSPQYQGMFMPGNIDLNNRPKIPMPGGGYQTVYTMTAGLDGGKQALLPRIVNGRVLSEEDAVHHFRKTGEHMGIFHSEQAANDYDKKLHADMGWIGKHNKWR